MKLRFPFVPPALKRAALLALCAVIPVQLAAAPTLRVQVNQRGDFALIGNGFGFEGAAGTPAPDLGTVGALGTNTADSSPDAFWRSDSPSDGEAEANSTITPAQARTTAVLNLPAGAQVTHAYLYWCATLSAPGSDTTATLDRPGASGFTASVTSVSTLTGPNSSYRSVADITSIVQANGNGAYRVSDVDIVNWVNLNNSNTFGGWWMVVLYRLEGEPLRQLTVSDGLDGVSGATPQNTTLSGFEVPGGPFTAKLGVVAMEGDNAGVGDALTFNGTTLSNDQNPANNFFNGTRSFLGAPVSVAGDLPRLAGTPQSMGGIDLDVMDVTSLLTAGQTSAPISATSVGDVYFLTTFITSVSTQSPKLDVLGNATTIASGDTTPDAADDTDFGSTLVSSGSIVRTFTLKNNGTEDLAVSSVGISAPSDFQLTAFSSSPITPGSSATFQITFDPSAEGLRTATVTVNSNDIDFPAYIFAVQGTGALPPPATLLADAVSVGVGGSRVYPLANDGPAAAGSEIVSVSDPLVTIAADGRSIVVPAGFTGSFTYITAAGNSGNVTATASAAAANSRILSGLLYDSTGAAAGWVRMGISTVGNATVQLRTASSIGRASLKLPASATTGSGPTSLGTLTATRNADGTISMDIATGALTGVLRPAPLTAVAVKYHIALASIDPAFPGGGFLIINLSSKGALRVAGAMPDGRSFSSASVQADNGAINFFGKQSVGVNPAGIIIGELVPANLPATDITGEVSWNKPAQIPGSKGTHLGGASTLLVANGSLFNGTIPLNGPGVLTLSGGNLTSDETTPVNVTGGIPTIPTGSLRAWIGVKPSNGRFTPRVIVPGVARPVSGTGLYLPKSQSAWGYFPGTSVGGRIELSVQ